MFMFNKANALPRSRQSSIDSLVTDPSTSTSTSDAWISNSSEASSYGELHSPESRESSFPSKRSSVFNLRSRSNTATSMTPSVVSFHPSMAGADTTQRLSQDYRQFAGQSAADAGKRSLFTRSRRGRRISNQFPSNASVDEDEDSGAGSRRLSVLRKARRGAHQSEAPSHHLKHRISTPFDFKHLTHTDRHQFAAMEQASDTELVTEFWAVRASQAPTRGLTGIKADDLHFQNFSSENLTAPLSPSAAASRCQSPLHCADSARQGRQPESPTKGFTDRTIRQSRSVESFSQPGIRPRTHRHSQSANAPPRSSSRQALARIDDLPEEFPEGSNSIAEHHLSRTSRSSGIWDGFAPSNASEGAERLPTITDEVDIIAHAVTTPDESAVPSTTPPFSPALSDVLGEPDLFVSPRPAPLPPVQSPRSPKSPFFESFSFRGMQRSPISRMNNRVSPFTSPKSVNQRAPMTRPISQMSDTLASPTLTRRCSIRRAPTVRRRSNTWRMIDDSWEDDVDYIYEHALEADCDYDWDRTSDYSVGEDRDRTPEQRDHEHLSAPISQKTRIASAASEDEPTLQLMLSGAFRASLLVPAISSVPELESRSAVSASTADTSLQTPLEPFAEFGLAPSLLMPPEFKDHLSREEMYDDILAEYESSGQHYPLIDASQSIASSSRSSRVRSSKRSSYDSSLMSSGLWSSPVRRSASSSGSLPELIHSRRSRKDFNTMVDQLSEQVSTFGSFDEDLEEVEDENGTPPGRPLQARTFFAADEEEHELEAVRQSIEGEVKASLELARQGSTRSTRAPLFHKYAASDGAAKQLASPPLTKAESQRDQLRTRAASSSNVVRGNRQPYLSLFPTPPKTPLSPFSPLPPTPK